MATLNQMNTKIALKEIEFFAYHGYYDVERMTGHLFVVDVEVEFDRDNREREAIDHTVNYEDLFKICKSSMDTPRILIETVVDEIVEEIKKKYNFVTAGKVVMKKKAPQLGGKVGSAIVEVTF